MLVVLSIASAAFAERLRNHNRHKNQVDNDFSPAYNVFVKQDRLNLEKIG
jgi:hypothetical protein